MFWRAFKNERSEDFTDAVSEVIASHRSAPLLKELSEATERIKSGRRGQTYASGYGSSLSVIGTLESAARANERANKEYVGQCLTVIRDRLSGKINLSQFEEACEFLEEVAVQIAGK